RSRLTGRGGAIPVPLSPSAEGFLLRAEFQAEIEAHAGGGRQSQCPVPAQEPRKLPLAHAGPPAQLVEREATPTDHILEVLDHRQLLSLCRHEGPRRRAIHPW